MYIYQYRAKPGVQCDYILAYTPTYHALTNSYRTHAYVVSPDLRHECAVEANQSPNQLLIGLSDHMLAFLLDELEARVNEPIRNQLNMTSAFICGMFIDWP